MERMRRTILAVLAGHGANTGSGVRNTQRQKLPMGDNCQDASVTIPTIPEHF